MVDIKSPTAENRREKRRKIVTTAAKYNGLPMTMGSHNKTIAGAAVAPHSSVAFYGMQ